MEFIYGILCGLQGWFPSLKMAIKTVFIISNQLMFKRGLESLVRQKDGLNIIGYEADKEHAVEQIEILHPDIVILDSTGSLQDNISEILHILNKNPDIKIISLNLNSNKLSVYQVKQRPVTGVQDLIEAIE